MEKGLIIGYDLCKDYCRISWFEEGRDEPQDLVFSDEENPYLVQNSICKKKGKDEWLIGQIAYETALLGGGAIVDKLLRMVAMKGFATFEGVRYSAEDLLYHFLDESLKLLFKAKNTTEISQIMFTVQDLDSVVLDTVIRCMKRLGIERKRIHIISHTEAYLFFVLSQKRELWSNISVLYDLSGDGLNYYEMEVLRGIKPNVAYAKRTFLEEGFSLDILNTPAGCRMADSIMTKCVERMLNKKLISSAYLSGNGMDACQKWGSSFLKVLCTRRRVFFIENLFAKGAVYAAGEYLRDTSAYPYKIMCEGRIDVDINFDGYKGMNLKTLNLASVGSNWYETKQSFDIIPDHETTLRFRVRKLGERSPLTLEIPLTDFDIRKNKMRRIGVNLSFSSENEFNVTLKDKGFGEFCPATDTVIRKTFTIS